MILLILYAACVALAAGLLTPIVQSAGRPTWLFALALLGPFTVIYLLGVVLALAFEQRTQGQP